MCKSKGLIFDIQGFSVHDGPGSRTTVFFSGCPLNCTWCANPEGREKKQQIMFSTQKCKSDLGCSRCMESCSLGSISFCEKILKRDINICGECKTFDCVNNCYHEALRLSGKYYSIEEIMNVLRRDREFWGNGGVTFSGGEPLLQTDFLKDVLVQCKNENIHTAIETTAYSESKKFLNIMSYIDFAFIDIKHMNSKLHKLKTSVGNEQILHNITLLRKTSWQGRLILRMPVIREYNDSNENIYEIIKFMLENDIFEINILPFHRMGASKWKQLGLEYEFKEEAPTKTEKLSEIQEMFLNSNIACYIGNEVMY